MRGAGVPALSVGCTWLNMSGVCGAEREDEPFGELLAFTASGYAFGLALGWILDTLGLQQSGLGQAAVRTLAGEGESIFEGVFALRRRLAGGPASMAEAYGWGKLLGMVLPWIVDLTSRLLGVDVYGVEGFYIPYFYSMGDQFGATVAGLTFLRRRHGSFGRAVGQYFRQPIMAASFAVLLLVPVGLLCARLAGFSPTTQLFTALETIAANLCWLPPLVGWWFGRRRGSSAGSDPS